MQTSLPPVVLKVALPVPLRQLFDYLPPEGEHSPRVGQRVKVTFGRRKMTGVVVECARQSALPLDKLAQVIEFPDGEQTVLTDESLALLKWCWRYYKHAPGEVVFNALPPALRKSDGVIPPPPVQYVLTDAGKERLLQAPGRIKAQLHLLEHISGGPATESQLRNVSPSWKKLLARLIEQRWVRSEIQRSAPMNASAGPVLLDEQRLAIDAITRALAVFTATS